MSTRRPSYSMGLDELLGMTKSRITPKLTSPIPERPSTRHGRGSVTGSSGTSTANSSEKSKENKSPSLSGIELVSNHAVDVWSNDVDVVSPVTDEDPSQKFPPRKLSNIRSISSSSSRNSRISEDSRGSMTDTVMTRTKTPKNQISGKTEVSSRPSTISTYSKNRTPIPPARTSIPREKSKIIENGKSKNDIKKEFELVKQKQGERTAYTLWLEKKLEEEKRKNREDKEKAQKEIEKRQEKLENAKKAFERWNSERTQKLKERKQLSVQKEKEKKEKEEKDKEEKKKEAEKVFEHWKNDKVYLKKVEKQREREKEEFRLRLLEEERQKKQEALKSFEVWKQQHEDTLKNIRTQHEEESRKKRDEQEHLNQVKEQLANDAFLLWMKMKEKQESFEQSLAYRVLQYENETKNKSPSPWIPVGGRSVPPTRRNSSTSLNQPRRSNSAKKVHFSRRSTSALRSRN